MPTNLADWIRDADQLEKRTLFGFTEVPEALLHVDKRYDDYYISLVGELFTHLKTPYEEMSKWATLGNAFSTIAHRLEKGPLGADSGISISESKLFAATAFYCGGYPASAYLSLKRVAHDSVSEVERSCFELLARPREIQTASVRRLMHALRDSQLEEIRDVMAEALKMEEKALGIGPAEWVGCRLFSQLLKRFHSSNLRAVLPEMGERFWDPLVRSFIEQPSPVLDFYPSQIEAIRRGLLGASPTFSLQMPTGAGKTALCETLLFHHLTSDPNGLGVLLVPFRSLASELRNSLVRRLNRMGVAARCAYAGTVPTQDEVRSFNAARCLVATPESLAELINVDTSFFNRISLVVCDEGHLIEGQSRGVSFELLLTRLKMRQPAAPRIVFISAIVPNIEEVHAWLGGQAETVVRSDYRPTQLEFGVLRADGNGAHANIHLSLNPHAPEAGRSSIQNFLSQSDFHFAGPGSRRGRTYAHSSMKSRCVAVARKCLGMGTVGVFSANKRGNQGAIGLAGELLSQLEFPLKMPQPIDFVRDAQRVNDVADYLALEFGANWVGTRALRAGAILHHGDIPQEAREAIEGLARAECVRLIFCTNTLAEGVNLPLRSLVLYSVVRVQQDGDRVNLLQRDIKNLVGRAGRAGSTTRGLIIAVNEGQWPIIEPVARDLPGERVEGFLHGLMGSLRRVLAQRELVISNEILEATPPLYSLIDGIDATLMDLAGEEIAQEELVRIAEDLAEHTFTAQQANRESLPLLRQVFALRATRLAEVRAAGRLPWLRATGARSRLLTSVESDLATKRERWDDIADPVDHGFVELVLRWAWDLPSFQRAVEHAYQPPAATFAEFHRTVQLWLEGRPIIDISAAVGRPMDDMLAIFSGAIAFELQRLVAQGIGLLGSLQLSRSNVLSPAALRFPDHLKHGVPTATGIMLADLGVRHRRAFVSLGLAPELQALQDVELIRETALSILEDTDRWLPILGRYVLAATKQDLSRGGE